MVAIKRKPLRSQTVAGWIMEVTTAVPVGRLQPAQLMTVSDLHRVKAVHSPLEERTVLVAAEVITKAAPEALLELSKPQAQKWLKIVDISTLSIMQGIRLGGNTAIGTVFI